jgi:hypothetical protein
MGEDGLREGARLFDVGVDSGIAFWRGHADLRKRQNSKKNEPETEYPGRE